MNKSWTVQELLGLRMIFLENLNKTDYFQGEKEGSKKHSERMAAAVEFFLAHFQGRYGGGEEDEAELR